MGVNVRVRRATARDSEAIAKMSARPVTEVRRLHMLEADLGRVVRMIRSPAGTEKSAASEEKLTDIVLEHGGEDLRDEGDVWEIVTEPNSFEAVFNAVKAAGIPTTSGEITMLASTYTKLEGPAANQMIRLLEALEDFDDTQNVYSNFDMDAEQMEQVAG